MQQDKNIMVGLEIATDRQGILKSTLAGGYNFSFVPQIILHPTSQDMIHFLEP